METLSFQLIGSRVLFWGPLRWYVAETRHQELLTDSQVVQGLMGILVILSLVLKRHREASRRPWRIWYNSSSLSLIFFTDSWISSRCFDVSKQVLGQAFIHGLNLLVSGIGAVHSYGKNACVFYFFNVLIDTTLGECYDVKLAV